MNVRQVMFAEGVAAGKSQSQAHADAGYVSKNHAQMAEILMRRADVQAYIKDAQSKLAAKTLLTKVKALERLSKTINGDNDDAATRAIARAAALLGWDAPTKTETVSITAEERDRRLAILMGDPHDP